MAGDDGSAGEIRRLPLPPELELDPLALEDEQAERLLDGALGPDQPPAGYGEVAALLAAVVAVPSPAELAGREAALAELRAATRTPGAMASWGVAGEGGVDASGCWSRSWSVACRPLASPPRPPGRCPLPSLPVPGASWRPWTTPPPCQPPPRVDRRPPVPATG